MLMAHVLHFKFKTKVSLPDSKGSLLYRRNNDFSNSDSTFLLVSALANKYAGNIQRSWRKSPHRNLNKVVKGCHTAELKLHTMSFS